MSENREEALPEVEIYTDGACSGNPGPGGYAAILRYGEVEKVITGSAPHSTNNRMELMAIIQALKVLKRRCRVKLYTDSRYVERALNEGWLEKWRSSGWKNSNKKKVKNLDLWQELLQLMERHEVQLHWVRGHADSEDNRRVDALAVEAARSQSYLESSDKNTNSE